MYYLGIDTTEKMSKIFLFSEEIPEKFYCQIVSGSASQDILPEIKLLCDRYDLTLSVIKRIGVITGPGSFTGLRVGIATAKGLANALNINCIGISQSEILANIFDLNKEFSVILKAGKDLIYQEDFTKEKRSKLNPKFFSQTEFNKKLISTLPIITFESLFTESKNVDNLIVASDNERVLSFYNLIKTNLEQTNKIVAIYTNSI